MDGAFDPGALRGLAATQRDTLTAQRLCDYRQLFDLAPTAPALTVHWMLFARFEADRREDGNPRALAPLPPLPFPRRMWAGGALRWHAPLPVGVPLLRVTRVADAQVKQGRATRTLFVGLERQVVGEDGTLYVEERHDYAFLPAEARPGARAGEPPPFKAAWSVPCRSDPVELFRYSALTCNSHRIHYDAAYCREVEHYANLVVHGPLLATRLMHAGGDRLGRAPSRFAYRAVRPLFVHEGYRLIGSTAQQGPLALAVCGEDETLRMSATID